MIYYYGQEGARQCVIDYCRENGIKYGYVAEKIGVHFSTISHFVNGDREMRSKNFKKLVNLLQEVGYLK